MLDLSRVRNYYVACGYTDLRRGIEGLAAIVTQQFGQELSEESLFLFCGRRTDRIKALYFSGDGYIQRVAGPVHLHSISRLVLYPHGCLGNPCPLPVFLAELCVHVRCGTVIFASSAIFCPQQCQIYPRTC